jgi:hypothetical protein
MTPEQLYQHHMRLMAAIIDIFEQADATPSDVFSVLEFVFTHFLGRVCPDCRRDITDVLIRHVPLMLVYAADHLDWQSTDPAQRH